MPQDPRLEHFSSHKTEEDVRRRQAAKARRRKKRRMQRMLLLGAFALAAVLLVVVIIMVFRSIFGKPAASSSTPSSVSVASVASVPVYGHPTATAAEAAEWYLQLVNGQQPIAQDFEMAGEQLGSIVQLPNHYWFDARVVDELNRMITDCNANEGYSLAIRSGYRSPSTQNKNYDYYVKLYMGQGMSQTEAEIQARMIEPPSGYSEHQLGLAVDFVTATVNDTIMAFMDTPEYQWLWDNAHNYGFVLRYPSEKESITGFVGQPYHWRYVGVDAATNIKNHQLNTGELICLEEYLMAATPPAAQEPASVPPATGSGSDISAGQAA